MANREDFTIDKSYRIRFQTGQELDCKCVRIRENDLDTRLRFVFQKTGTIRIYPFDIEIVSEIKDVFRRYGRK